MTGLQLHIAAFADMSQFSLKVVLVVNIQKR